MGNHIPARIRGAVDATGTPPPATAFCRCTLCNAKRFEALKRFQWVRLDTWEDGSAVLHARMNFLVSFEPIAASSVEEAVDMLRLKLREMGLETP